jgi:hypothetical protein
MLLLLLPLLLFLLLLGVDTVKLRGQTAAACCYGGYKGCYCRWNVAAVVVAGKTVVASAGACCIEDVAVGKRDDLHSCGMDITTGAAGRTG